MRCPKMRFRESDSAQDPRTVPGCLGTRDGNGRPVDVSIESTRRAKHVGSGLRVSYIAHFGGAAVTGQAIVPQAGDGSIIGLTIPMIKVVCAEFDALAVTYGSLFHLLEDDRVGGNVLMVFLARLGEADEIG